MSFSDEIVMAYVDGELDESVRAAVDAALATDPELAQRIARQRTLRERLRREFDPVLQEQIPERLLAAAQSRSARARPAGAIPLRQRPTRLWSWPQWSAMAASLIIGVLIAPLLWRRPVETPLGMRDGQLLATGTLARALSEQLASNQAAGAPVHIGVSFLSRDGSYCRTFVLHEKSALAGLACYQQGGWRLQAAAATADLSSAPGGYQTAASSLPSAIEQVVSQLIVGEPLDASAETAARAKGWHR